MDTKVLQLTQRQIDLDLLRITPHPIAHAGDAIENLVNRILELRQILSYLILDQLLFEIVLEKFVQVDF